VESNKEFECVSVLHGHTQDVKSVKWHPTKEVRHTRHPAHGLHPFSTTGGGRGGGALTTKRRVAWEQVLVSCSYDDTIKLWADDQDDWYCLDTLTGHTSTVWEVALSKDGERMGTATPYSIPPIRILIIILCRTRARGGGLVGGCAHARVVLCVRTCSFVQR
jgi:WD40 repeat protein